MLTFGAHRRGRTGVCAQYTAETREV